MSTKQENTQGYHEWQSYRETLRKTTTINHNESVSEKQKRIARLEANPEEWFKYYFELAYSSEAADFQKRSTKKVMEFMELFLMRCWSRELSKTTRTRMEVLKLILTGKKKNVLLVSNSEDNARRLLEPYRAHLDTNQRIIHDYGRQRGAKWREGDFKTRQGVAFRAVGADQSPRGSNNDAIRPDVILIDDIDTDQDCLNPEIIEKRTKWIFEALIPTRAVNVPLLIIGCGNIIAEYCCVTELNKKADYVEVVNIRTNGKSSWPQKNTEEMIDRVLATIPYSSVQKEYFNTPETKGKTFPDITYAKIPRMASMEQLVVYGDPSTSNRSVKNAGSSYKVVALLGRKENITYIVKIFCKQCSQADFIQAYYDMYTIVTTAGCTAHYYMECNSLQEGYYDSFFDPEFKRISKETRIPLFVKKDERVKANKFTRVEGTLEPANRLGWLIFNAAEETNADMEIAVGQFKAVSPTYNGPIDAPDCIEGGYKVLDLKGGMALNNFRHQKRNSRRY